MKNLGSVISMIRDVLQRAIDLCDAAVPAPVPDKAARDTARIIAHRGVHDNRTVFENTIEAFDTALRGGLWGVEFDVRWTGDLKPVVIHDPTGRRVFGRDLAIRDTGFQRIREQLPLIPLFEDVLRRFGGKIHLMIEIKKDGLSARPEDRNAELRGLERLLKTLKPVDDFHLLSREPDVFEELQALPRSSFVPVAVGDVRRLSRIGLQKGYGGFAGYYLLLGDAICRRHHEKGQKVGTGFIASKSRLFREIRRGIDWIFTDRPLEMAAFLDIVGTPVIRPARPGEMDLLRDLFRRYADTVGVEKCFEDFEVEVSSLPGPYGGPLGCLLIALEADRAVGCVALRPLGPGSAEIKRLYVLPASQGHGLGRALVLAVLDEARAHGYAEVYLHTLPAMVRAAGLYRSLGFEEIPPYHPNPVPGAWHFRLRLAR